MPAPETNLAERSGNLVEAHKGYDPRIIFFYFALAALLLLLAGGLAYHQLVLSGTTANQERLQTQRRVLVPGPRGNIYARDGETVLVGNRPRFSVVIYLGEVRTEIFKEYQQIKKNYLAKAEGEVPSNDQRRTIARTVVVQRYLDQVNRILGRAEKVDTAKLNRHLQAQRLLPYVLIEDLEPEEFAKLIEYLPVQSPLQVYTSSTRTYPFGSAAAHTLGYVRTDNEIDAEDFPGEDLRTFRMKGAIGRTGLEKQFDEYLQGQPGGTIFRVDNQGYRVNPPLDSRLPIQGKKLVTSIDIDLQIAAEDAIGDFAGGVVALDVNTGEVLVLASRPDFDLNDFSPRLSQAKYTEIQAKHAEIHRAIYSAQAPGSTFKIITALAALRAGVITPESTYNCPGNYMVGKRSFACHDGHAHGEMNLEQAIEKSCNVFFYHYGLRTGIEAIAAEARRFGLNEPTGIELESEAKHQVVGDPAWKHQRYGEAWRDGDTANTSIGQGFLGVTPLQMACMMASFARGETITKPTLIHDPNRVPQHTTPLGISPSAYDVLVDGLEKVTLTGTARTLNTPVFKIPGLRIGGKTGTAQKTVSIEGRSGIINFAWFVCFAPVEKPEIAIAVMLEGDVIGEETGGGRYATPVARAILAKWWEKKHQPSGARISLGVTK